MSLRELLEERTYIPILSVRPAEMLALEELPNTNKDLVLPIFLIRPWTTAHHLESTLFRIEDAYGERPLIADLAYETSPDAPTRPVHNELDKLKDPSNGYVNWCNFISKNENFIPTLQISNPDQSKPQIDQWRPQIERMAEINRGLVIRVSEQEITAVTPILREAGHYIDAHNILLVFDFAQQKHNFLERQAEITSLCQRANDELPDLNICTSASSFPNSFTQITDQDIYERALFKDVAHHAPECRLTYGDRGSARAESQSGGGGAPTPRIDYPLRDNWRFHRQEDNGDRFGAYVNAALDTLNSPEWDGNLRIWGTQMIERTAQEDPSAIKSPMRSTAVRINIHLHRQTFYNADGEKIYNTDEDWND